MTVDAHLHLWDLDRVTYPWLTDALAPIDRTFAFPEVEPQLERAGVDRVVLVQAANSVEDSSAMFAVSSPRVAGVVAWVDLLDPTAAARQLDQWSAHPSFVGVRHLIHDEPDPDWLARPAVRSSLALLAARGLGFDVIGVLPRHLEHAVSLADELPSLRLVIDHLGTPPVGADSAQPWAGLLTELSRRPNVFVKLSGLTTLAGGSGAARLRPYVDHALDAFGSARVLYGGDWPVSTLAGPYAETWATTEALLAGASDGEREDVLTRSAERAYRLGAY
ncbi:amidohydrolase family protein [Leifsonia shinshuensis]|uniref:Amidohydrolase family protein n=1 Tax=Leifsonia shinshuensis TaxID=150026 RepID=A0A7G6YC14_9MICO|nr:amidohydrolase family protein [Leifsonia shinshuensis]QNE36029.1 amidohydrolase family protein [Leifsonia shinshuensis]